MIERFYGLLVLITVALYGLSSSASASDDVPVSQFSKHHWQIADAYCPIGCPKGVISFLKSYRGQGVELSETEYKAPFADDCEGEIHLQIQTSSARSIVADLNKGLKPGRRKITIKNLKVTDGDVKNAIVFCDSANIDLPVARILSIEQDRILVLFESQSIIELR